MRACLRCKRPTATTPSEGVRRHGGRGLCASCYLHERKAGRITKYPLMRNIYPKQPENCPICYEVEAMRTWATSEQIVTALGRTAEAVDIHLRRHSPHLRDAVLPATRREWAARKRARAA